jgi:dGTPase
VPRYAAILETVETQFPGVNPRECFHECLRHLVDWLVSGLIDGTVARAEAAGAANVDDVRRFEGRLAGFTEEAAETSRALKRFLFARVYDSPALGEDRRRSMQMIAELFQFFLEHPDRLPEAYAQLAAEKSPHRVVCDYMAGMTDVFFRRTYEQML